MTKRKYGPYVCQLHKDVMGKEVVYQGVAGGRDTEEFLVFDDRDVLILREYFLEGEQNFWKNISSIKDIWIPSCEKDLREKNYGKEKRIKTSSGHYVLVDTGRETKKQLLNRMGAYKEAVVFWDAYQKESLEGKTGK